MKTYLILFCSLFLFSISCFGQASLHVNGWVDLEAYKGEKTSRFYYNELGGGGDSKTDLKSEIRNINLLVEAKLNSELSLNVRGLLNRNQVATLDDFLLPLANISYRPEEKNWGLTVGRFVTPFGDFSKKQHSKDRTFINLPLAYSSYVNISPKVGFVNNLGERNPDPNQIGVVIDGVPQWGSTLLYYGAYTNGVLLDYELVPDKLDWSIAFTNSAPSILADVLDFDNWGIATQLQFQPNYFWKQGISFSHGSFWEDSSVREQLADATNMKQTLLGTDITLGSGFWEFTGELMGSWYTIPEYNVEAPASTNEDINLSSISGYLNIRYELPFLSGFYTAYGIDFLSFSDLDNSDSKWDNNVFRHNFGVGYKITNFLLFRTNYMLQEVANKPVWEVNTWRSTLTVYF